VKASQATQDFDGYIERLFGAEPSNPTPRKRVAKLQTNYETHGTHGLGQIIPASAGEGDVQIGAEARCTHDVSLIIALWRQRQDLRRAEQRLNLQCQAICRRYSDGDKDVAAKVWASVESGTCENDGLLMVLMPLLQAMGPPADAAKAIETKLRKLARAHPLWTTWAKDVKGFGELSFAGFLAEAGRPITDYRTVSCLWKRFGLAVIGGERQRRVKDAETALAHGYSPQRRSFVYVLATSLMRCQGDSGPYRVMYDERKAIEIERTSSAGHAHNRAARYMTKALVKNAWVAARTLASPTF
jgi:hypothetical protein